MTLRTRAVRGSDATALLTLNNAAVPAVNLLDAGELTALLAEAHATIAVVDETADDRVLGFVLTLRPGVAYDSENYVWFSKRSSDFLYVDRIVVAETARDQGIGAVLYAAVFEAARAAGAGRVFCEVNLEPPNPGSLRFHRRLGFAEVGQQATKGGSVVVTMLEAQV